MDIWNQIDLPKGWEKSIFSRGIFVTSVFKNKGGEFTDWISCLEAISERDNGLYWVWLTITGCYPNKFELQSFISDFQIRGLRKSILKLIKVRAENPLTKRYLMEVNLVKPIHTELVDITHTIQMPYLTGIQRVVRGVAFDVDGISTFTWVGESGIMVEKSHTEGSADNFISFNNNWRLRLITFLHSFVPTLHRTPSGKKLYSIILPAAKSFKRYLLKNEAVFLLRNSSTLKNILILNTRITIPEIPSLNHIILYEAILEHSIISIQIILYDFIPLFHEWTVNYENRGSLNIYLRLVLLANRVISISQLVQEQAILITKAFNLERPEWERRVQVFDYLPLPSGLSPVRSGEFAKHPHLVVMAGSLEPRKNHLQFLDALEILDGRGVQVDGVILGSAGWANDLILSRIHELHAKGINISREANLTDDEMREWVGKAQVLLQISEAEGFGLPIAEALSLGTKVIVSNIRPLNEWVGDRVQLVELGDAQRLAELIREILLSPELESIPSKSDISWNEWTNLLYFTK